MSVSGIDEDLPAPGDILEGLLSVSPVNTKDHEIALDGFLFRARPGQGSEFVDYASQAFGPSGVGDDDLVAGGDKVAGDGLADVTRANDSDLHF